MHDNKYIVAIAITVLVGLAPFVQDRLARPEKRLDYSFDVREVAGRPSGGVAKSLRILFGDRQVEHVDALVVQIENSGRVPIRRDDFDGDLLIEFGEKAEILEAGNLSDAGTIPVSFEPAGSRVAVKPWLLNPGERTIVQFLLAGERGRPRVSARIAGLSSLREKVEEPVRYSQPWWGVWLDAMVAVLLMSISVGLLLSFFLRRFRHRGAVVIGRAEAYVLAVSGWLAGWSLIGHWGEKVNFSLNSRIANAVLAIVFITANVFVWLSARGRMMARIEDTVPPLVGNQIGDAAAQQRAGADGAEQH